MQNPETIINKKDTLHLNPKLNACRIYWAAVWQNSAYKIIDLAVGKSEVFMNGNFLGRCGEVRLY